ncbi:hypothetical protein, partial [Nocardia carnea]|uniref:hypothetical protein n=1 Tax=Nocardia carnea TaxID=37328 RepID=UPI0024564DE6
PPWAKRIIGSDRTFWSLPADVKVIDELTPEETQTILARAAAGRPGWAARYPGHSPVGATPGTPGYRGAAEQLDDSPATAVPAR